MRSTLLWQSYAHLYDGLLDLMTYTDMLKRVADLADCSGRTVLDAGSGTGNVAQAVLDAGAQHVTLIDFSANMLDRARHKLAPHVADGRATICCGELISTMRSLPAQSVDRITAVNVLYTLSDRSAFFEQAARVLTPDGSMVAAHTTRPGSGPILRDQWRRGGLRACVRPRLIGIAAVDLVIDLLARGGRYDFTPVAQLAQEAAAAGDFEMVSLGRCYGAGDGVNELIRFTRVPSVPEVAVIDLADQQAVQDQS